MTETQKVADVKRRLWDAWNPYHNPTRTRISARDHLSVMITELTLHIKMDEANAVCFLVNSRRLRPRNPCKSMVFFSILINAVHSSDTCAPGRKLRVCS
jgi:hypothetical protein